MREYEEDQAFVCANRRRVFLAVLEARKARRISCICLQSPDEMPPARQVGVASVQDNLGLGFDFFFWSPESPLNHQRRGEDWQ